MSNPRSSSSAQRLQLALDMFDLGLSIQRQNLRRAHPRASAEEIDRELARWLRTRPGAEHGDAVGRSVKRVESPP